MCHGACVEEHNLAGVCFFLPPYMFRNQTLISRLSSKFLYLLSCFADPVLEVFTKIVFYCFYLNSSDGSQDHFQAQYEWKDSKELNQAVLLLVSLQ